MTDTAYGEASPATALRSLASTAAAAGPGAPVMEALRMMTSATQAVGRAAEIGRIGAVAAGFPQAAAPGTDEVHPPMGPVTFAPIPAPQHDARPFSAVPPFRATAAGRMELLAAQQVAATLASAMIVSSGRPHDLKETMAVFGTVLRRFWPEPT